MEKRPSYVERSIEDYSENELIDVFETMLEVSGQQIEFDIAERPAANQIRGKGIIRATERISDRDLLVVETDRLSNKPFSINGDLTVWRKKLDDDQKYISISNDYADAHDAIIKIERQRSKNRVSVKHVTSENFGSEKTVGGFEVAKALLKEWFEK